MNIAKFVRHTGLGALAVTAAAIAGLTSIQTVEAEGIIDRLNMLESAGTSSENGINPADFDIAVIDTMIEQLMSMAETAMIGMMSDDPEIAEMSAEMMTMIEAELEHLNEMRRAKITERLDGFRSTSSESGIR
ncbi:MAG: hypothetical protein AAGA40_12490 [Cyanobacteria bacterium P01_E01_bin.45]